MTDLPPHLIGLLWSLPWILTGVVFAVRYKMPPELPPPALPEPPPRLSVIIPARNEEGNIGACLESLLVSGYPDLQILVVDDRSEDRTAEIVAGFSARVPEVALIAGEPLPDGWFGKPWACWQGARAATGDLLLFTDADTIHTPDLAARSVTALVQADAGALTLVGRQIMESFWERAVQPQVFVMLMMGFKDISTAYDPKLADPARWRDAIANGQYILMSRDAYERLGGHERVKGEVVEDLRLAQEIVKEGLGLALRDATDLFSTRMYTSLGGLIEGWTKNVATAARQTRGPVHARFAVPAAAVVLALLWVAPPLSLVGAALGLGGPAFLTWAAVATGCGLAIWSAAAVVFRIPPWSGLAYPLGAAVAAFILLRSGIRGSRIRWKGRDYRALS